jgi:hypothetical protein
MGSSPVESMDRDKAYIPSLQIQFLDNIVIPVYGCVFVYLLGLPMQICNKTVLIKQKPLFTLLPA